MTNLMIPVGIPGCGKSTWAKSLLDLHYTVVSTDGIRKRLFGSLKAAHPTDHSLKMANNDLVFAEFHFQIENHLRHGIDTVADATSLRRWSREKLLEIAENCYAKAHLILFKNPSEGFLRNRRRSDDQVVPEDQMLNMLAQYYELLRDVAQEPYDTVTEIASFKSPVAEHLKDDGENHS